MRSTENEMLPICWPDNWELPDMCWLDNWCSADRSDFTAAMFIKAELSNSWEFKEERIWKSLYCPDVSLESLETEADTSWVEACGEWIALSSAERVSNTRTQEGPRTLCNRCATLKSVLSACTFFGVRIILSRWSIEVSDFFDPGDCKMLFFSPSFGLLIVNLQSDARKEFKGSIARRTPQAWVNAWYPFNISNIIASPCDLIKISDRESRMVNHVELTIAIQRRANCPLHSILFDSHFGDSS
jgi:hypothetical protein